MHPAPFFKQRQIPGSCMKVGCRKLRPGLEVLEVRAPIKFSPQAPGGSLPDAIITVDVKPGKLPAYLTCDNLDRTVGQTSDRSPELNKDMSREAVYVTEIPSDQARMSKHPVDTQSQKPGFFSHNRGNIENELALGTSVCVSDLSDGPDAESLDCLEA
ncbi:hypothetical protein RRG08_039971 [Elysia crispata]|uniref:Uncharacterized protein n=1 Tax=Elysia crispata TaxID=231223 RepID=A0AAE0Z7Y3_9GAST|nr:hypothetical protein RRG08_039971 [Elysia crispata]